MANELTTNQQFPTQYFATSAEVKSFIKSIPGYGQASILVFPNQRMFDKYAPKGSLVQTVFAKVKDQWADGFKEYIFAVTI